MLTQHLKTGFSALFLLAIAAASSAAQQAPSAPQAQAAMECGGQYECIEDRPLTPAEARASLAYPQSAQSQNATRVAARKPMPTGADADADARR